MYMSSSVELYKTLPYASGVGLFILPKNIFFLSKSIFILPKNIFNIQKNIFFLPKSIFILPKNEDTMLFQRLLLCPITRFHQTCEDSTYVLIWQYRLGQKASCPPRWRWQGESWTRWCRPPTSTPPPWDCWGNWWNWHHHAHPQLIKHVSPSNHLLKSRLST